jgi:hypothetical protein
MERERGVEEESCILVPSDQLENRQSLAEFQGGEEKTRLLDSGTGTFINVTATPSAELGHQKLREGWQTYKEFEEFRRCEQSVLTLQEFLVQWEASPFSLFLLNFLSNKISTGASIAVFAESEL